MPIVRTELQQPAQAAGVAREKNNADTTCSIQSDPYVCVCQDSELIVLDARSGNAVNRLVITADEAAVMNQASKIVAPQGQGHQPEIFKVMESSEMTLKNDTTISEPIVFWCWILPTIMALVTASAVLHWSIEEDFGPQKIFDRDSKLEGCQVTGYSYSESGDAKWCFLLAISEGVIAGTLQLYSVDTRVSQILNGVHMATFAMIDIPGRVAESQVLCFTEEEKTGSTAKLRLMEVGATGDVFGFSPEHIQSPLDTPDDFPVSMQVSRKHGIIFLTTSRGYMSMFDVFSGKALYREKISDQTTFLSTTQDDIGGAVGITAGTDSVLKMDANEASVVSYVANSLHDIELANQLATRLNLTIEDKVAILRDMEHSNPSAALAFATNLVMTEELQVADKVIEDKIFANLKRTELAKLCEKAGLHQRSLSHYSETSDIKRVMAAHAPDLDLEFKVSFFGSLNRKKSIQVLTEMLSTENMTQNLNTVVQISTTYSDKIGTTNLIEMFERFERWDGLYLYLGAIVKDSTEGKVLLKFINAAIHMQKFEEVDRVCRESTVSKAEKVKLYEEVVKIYTKCGSQAHGGLKTTMHLAAVEVLLEKLDCLQRAKRLAQAFADKAVWIKVAKALHKKGMMEEACDYFSMAEDPRNHSAEVDGSNPQRGELRVRGLANLGNTCFVNSTLQVLASIPAFAQGLLDSHGAQVSRPQAGVGQAVAETVGQILGVRPEVGPLEVVWPTAVMAKFGRIGPRKEYKLGRQNDAHAFLGHLLETIQKRSKAKKKMVKAIFGGEARTRIKCLSCGRPGSVHISDFQHLSLAIEGAPTVDLAMKKFMSGDEVERRCPGLRCEGNKAMKITTVQKAPNALVVSLNIFKPDHASNSVKRIEDKISFGRTLDVPIPEGNAQYELTGVIDHHGDSPDHGHYMAYVRTVDGHWFKADDERVEEVDFETVKRAKAYVLVYSRMKSSRPWAVVREWAKKALTAVRDLGGRLCGGCGGCD